MSYVANKKTDVHTIDTHSLQGTIRTISAARDVLITRLWSSRAGIYRKKSICISPAIIIPTNMFPPF